MITIINELKPVTPSSRNTVRIKTLSLSKKPLIKAKIQGLKNSAGRNNSGKITVKHKGGGKKRRYRKIDFFRTKTSTGVVIGIEYDPIRTANIASVFDEKNKEYYYITAPKYVKVGSIVRSGDLAKPKSGHALKIESIPIGSFIHNITVNEKKGAQLCRSAGSFARILEKKDGKAKIVLRSGKNQLINLECIATFGCVSNELWLLNTLGKAGRARWLNRRPSVRGVAMNPVDHPHGGGEGKKSGKGKTPWGKPIKSGPTSTSNKRNLKKR